MACALRWSHLGSLDDCNDKGMGSVCPYAKLVVPRRALDLKCKTVVWRSRVTKRLTTDLMAGHANVWASM